MRPCISIYNLTQLGPILKPDKALKLFACAYDVDESMIDKGALKEYLVLQRNGGKPPAGAQAAVSAATTDSKDAKALEKAKKKAEKPSGNTSATT